jgi:hypothetical protein
MRIRNPLPDALVRANAIVVVAVFAEDRIEVSLAQDQNVIQALSADTADHTLTVGVRVWCPVWCL